MGLDMYLYKTAKINDATQEDYVRYYDETHFKNAQEIYDNPNIPDVLKARIRQAAPDLSGWEHYMSPFEEVGYWRKFNALHAFFVDSFQDGVDECQLSRPLNREDLEKTLEAVKADNLKPRSGFFFGSTDKDMFYEQDRENTIELLEKLLEETDFDKEVFFYRSSW